VSAAFQTKETAPRRPWDSAYGIATPERSFNIRAQPGPHRQGQGDHRSARRRGKLQRPWPPGEPGLPSGAADPPLRDVFSTFVGWDNLLVASLVEGAAGVMVGTGNVVPDELVEVWDAVQTIDIQRAREAWSGIYRVIDASMQQAFVWGVRAVLGAVALPVGAPRAPVAPLAPATTSHTPIWSRKLVLAPAS
jgi:4-hydroxy-tetrahydrodipicolinate synthase